MSLPLSKYKVVEFQGLAPSLFSELVIYYRILKKLKNYLGGMILADYGAEVILLCRPDPPPLGLPIETNYM